MKKLLAFGLTAVVVALATTRPADAWVNCKFSVGLNWHFQSGNNSLLWGAYKNGQIPDFYGYGYGHPPHSVLGGPPAAPGQQPFPWFGQTQQQPTMPQASTGAAQAYGGGSGGYYYPASYSGSAYPYSYGSNLFTWFYER